jgi:transposase-like protein
MRSGQPTNNPFGNSNNYGAVQRVSRLSRHLERLVGQRAAAAPPRPTYQPRKLQQRLSDDAVSAVLAAYSAGATTREVGERFGIAHSSVNKLLKQHGVVARRRSPSPDDVQQAVELYGAGLSTRVIAEHLGFGASTILRALTKAGVTIRTRFSVEPQA